MNLLDIISIGFALSMDAVAVNISRSTTLKELKLKDYLIPSLFFGLFQMIMPLIGYLISYAFYNKIKSISNILTFIILMYLGLSLFKKKNSIIFDLNIKELLFLSLITSIDALTIGITLSMQNKSIIPSSIIIGLITFLLCNISTYIGFYFGNKHERVGFIIGGIILIIIALKTII